MVQSSIQPYTNFWFKLTACSGYQYYPYTTGTVEAKDTTLNLLIIAQISTETGFIWSFLQNRRLIPVALFSPPGTGQKKPRISGASLLLVRLRDQKGFWRRRPVCAPGATGTRTSLCSSAAAARRDSVRWREHTDRM